MSELDRYAPGATGPAYKHMLIVPADADLVPTPRSIYCLEDGVIVVRDTEGVDISYPLSAGQELPFRATQVRIGTTGSYVNWYK